ncbi:uridine kinase [Lysinibacillus xylanilyticus]|uniref:Uridine kinase n=1 Tax=Lysinibacillus xylanilyticus TaxID=582475 RepID=A0A0K9FAC1_9BACI|nr:kinase [Lysinibacillus xylanilyticus]KMY31549.1 uridine kinase [Lysinibacillus xylanilyticus]
MDMNDILKQEIKEEYKKHHLDRPFIVAIDGLSGAGKTTLVHQLKNVIDNVVILHIDDHIVKREMRYNTGYDEWFEYYQLQWDTIYLKEILYEKLHQNEKQLLLPFYNKEEDTLTSKSINLPPNSTVIIEGIFLLREEWKTFYDYIIFLDCPKEVRYERVLHRDTYLGDLEERLKKYQKRYWVAENYYLEKQTPLKFAHSIQRV